MCGGGGWPVPGRGGGAAPPARKGERRARAEGRGRRGSSGGRSLAPHAVLGSPGSCVGAGRGPVPLARWWSVVGEGPDPERRRSRRRAPGGEPRSSRPGPPPRAAASGPGSAVRARPSLPAGDPGLRPVGAARAEAESRAGPRPGDACPGGGPRDAAAPSAAARFPPGCGRAALRAPSPRWVGGRRGVVVQGAQARRAVRRPAPQPCGGCARGGASVKEGGEAALAAVPVGGGGGALVVGVGRGPAVGGDRRAPPRPPPTPPAAPASSRCSLHPPHPCLPARVRLPRSARCPGGLPPSPPPPPPSPAGPPPVPPARAPRPRPRFRPPPSWGGRRLGPRASAVAFPVPGSSFGRCLSFPSPGLARAPLAPPWRALRDATSDQTWRPAEFKHISQRRKRN